MGGVTGLASILTYALEVKLYNQAICQPDSKKKAEKLTGIALKMNEMFEIKIAELEEIRELISTAQCHKRQLLENLCEEKIKS